jgi:hypothetical protein
MPRQSAELSGRVARVESHATQSRSPKHAAASIPLRTGLYGFARTVYYGRVRFVSPPGGSDRVPRSPRQEATSDEDLMVRVREGDDRALSELYDRHASLAAR